MRWNLTIFISLTLFSLVHTTKAQETIPVEIIPEATLSEIGSQDDWVLTKHDPSIKGEIREAVSESNEKYIEILNDKSLFATKTRPPMQSGAFKFKAKHNKSGLFYIYAQTSDNGGQLLFSIQFTEDKGILLEQSDKQVTLMSTYAPDQWYLFSIDFDSERGTSGTFTVQVDSTSYGEFPYVNSESEIFDFAQLTLGSESIGRTSISGFADLIPNLEIAATTTATTTTSEALLLLSITMSSTSISSDLDNGLIVTASLDGIPGVAITSATDTATGTISTTNPDTADDSTGVVDFVVEIIEDIIDVFVPEEEVAEEPIVDDVVEENLTPTPPEVASTTEELPAVEEEPSLPEVVPESPLPPPEPEPEVITSEVEANHETVTTEF